MTDDAKALPELIERLRKPCIEDCGPDGSRGPFLVPDPLCAKAADTIEAQSAELQRLREALRNLIRGYVNTLENGRDRIMFLGGECDPVDVMERNDIHLRAARAALAQREEGDA